MNLFNLMDTLEAELNALFSEDKYEVKGDTDLQPTLLKGPQVLQGWYTDKKSREDFPYILISPVSDGTDWEEDVLKVMLVFGAYGLDSDAWKDAALMANKVKLYLNEKYIIGKRFALLKERGRPLRIEYPDAQPFPQWFCFMNLEFNAYNAQPDNIFKGGRYGEGVDTY